jgi:hypothetical protein
MRSPGSNNSVPLPPGTGAARIKAYIQHIYKGDTLDAPLSDEFWNPPGVGLALTVYMECHTGCHPLNRVLTENNVVKGGNPTRG